MRRYKHYLIIVLLLISAIYLIDFDKKEESTNELIAIRLDEDVKTKDLFKMGREVYFNELTRDELIDKLNKNLYDTLKNTGHYFVDYSIKTGLDPYLAVSIVNLETGCKWGCSYLTKYQNNIGGLRRNGAYLSFNSLEEGINYYLDLLYNNYWLQGLTTPELMNSKYAESTLWASKVNAYYQAIIES